MRARIPRSLSILVLAAMLLTGGAAAGLSGAGELRHSLWNLTDLPGQSLLPGAQITLRIEGERVGGSDGCNHYGGTATVDGEIFRLADKLASTEMACAAPVMRQAAAFLAALQRAAASRLENGRLTLLDADGTAVASFVAAPRELAGTAWRVTGVNNGQQAVTGVLEDSALTLAFGADGQAGGAAGCNRFTAGYEAAGETLSITAPAATRRFCSVPEGVMEQEAAYLAAFETVAVARREGDRLELRTADGALAVSLTLTPPPATAGASPDTPVAAPDTAIAAPQIGIDRLNLPATFQGDLPCADCEGIRHHLDLWPDNVFHLRREWLGRDLVRDEFGRWQFDPGRSALVLVGGAERPLQFEVLPDAGLRMLDVEGRHISSELPYELSNTGALAPVDLNLLFRGEMIYMADAARITVCSTGRSFPIALEDDFISIERAYLANVATPGGPLLVSFDGSLVDRPAADGPGSERTIVVRHFVDVWPEQRCEH